MTTLNLRIDQVISYMEMCQTEGCQLQRGMNFHLRGGLSVILMSVRKGAPYADRIEDDGRVLIYEGHNVPREKGGPNPDTIDQPMTIAGGSLTQNGLFFAAAKRAKAGATPELVRVYEKLKKGIWSFAGAFQLVDAWQEESGGRQVFKFRLELDSKNAPISAGAVDIEQTRIIPVDVKIAVLNRDGYKCVKCGATDNLHFDHILPYSKGGSSLVVENIQILCARHNLAKRDRIE